MNLDIDKEDLYFRSLKEIDFNSKYSYIESLLAKRNRLIEEVKQYTTLDEIEQIRSLIKLVNYDIIKELQLEIYE